MAADAATSSSSRAKSSQSSGKQTDSSFATVGKSGQTVWEPGLPAEVVSRRIHKPAKKVADKVDEAPIVCELKVTLKMAPEAKSEWLEQVLAALARGKAKSQDVYNIIAHPKFVLGIPVRIGQKMFRHVADAVDSFSDRQQKGLLSQSRFADLFSPAGTGEMAVEEDEADRCSDRSESEDVRRRREDERRRQAKQTAAEKEKLQREAWEKEEARHRSEEDKLKERKQEAARIQSRGQEEDKSKEEARRKAEEERKAAEDKERQRKAKIGKAFLIGEDEDDEPPKKVAASTLQLRRDLRKDDPIQREEMVQDLALKSIKGSASNPWAVDAMGGDKVLAEAHAILRKAGGSSAPPRDRSDSRPARSRRKQRSRSRSISRGGRRREAKGSSLRSPTPDGRARGQMRAARKAKMMASILGVPAPRR